jgi:hypothetical protein
LFQGAMNFVRAGFAVRFSPLATVSKNSSNFFDF